ncbi:MAG: InlB B-repeat-containing protein [Gemmiger sp.]|uniref:InlB B-repeat-containing protein n=1 Tax=Gemmiger sp. TaxID=2049027 RepID=UPI002E7A351B|nr:InlB B-repeat-containing protein [Gemmiger sp.]MEE0800712.1 InlB B-repeat-containing protein [Gemmiger sp.]
MKHTLTTALPVLCLVGCALFGCAPAEYTVTFDANYGGQTPASQVISGGQTVQEVQAPTREGYTFLGWFRDAGLTQPWDSAADKVREDMTLYAGWDRDTGDTITDTAADKDFSDLTTAGSQEDAYDYTSWFLPARDGAGQPYVGDPMPYYEDGTYYIYYLKDGGDSYNHSVYLATTTDFVSYTEYDDPVLEASRSGGQDSWIGTGSVVKAGDRYYFFYTGHTDSAAMEYAEKILVAVGDSPLSFQKMEGWEITPPAELGQKRDFRDPQAYYDPATGAITLTVTASQDGTARILKYTLSADLQTVQYDGIIFTDPTGEFWNLECSDTFCIGDTWYLTYSAQDDTLWYATAQAPYGPYGEPVRLDGKLFYAAKHVEDGQNAYMVGWARRSESPSSTQDVAAWGGNLVVQQLVRREDGSLCLAPAQPVADSFSVRRALAIPDTHTCVEAGTLYTYTDAFTCQERFLLSGEFTFTGTGSFGLSFDYNGQPEKNKLISLSPADGKLRLLFNEGSTPIAETDVDLQPGQTYAFTYLQEGSVGVFYLDGQAALTVRIYGASGKPIQLFAENNTVTFTSLREYTRP